MTFAIPPVEERASHGGSLVVKVPRPGVGDHWEACATAAMH